MIIPRRALERQRFLFQRLNGTAPQAETNQACLGVLSSLPQSLQDHYHSDKALAKMHGTDFHSGTTTVPTALQFCMCLSILVIIRGGGHIQLFSLLQSHVKASTASVPQDQNLELNLGNCALLLFANLSTECGPQIPSSHLKTSGFKYQSSTSASLLT